MGKSSLTDCDHPGKVPVAKRKAIHSGWDVTGDRRLRSIAALVVSDSEWGILSKAWQPGASLLKRRMLLRFGTTLRKKPVPARDQAA